MLTRKGYLLYVVLSLLSIAAIFAFALSQFRSRSVEQLSRTIEQHRLIALAQSASNEIYATMLKEANDPSGYKDTDHFGGMFRVVTTVDDAERPRNKYFTLERTLSPSNFQNTLALIEQNLPGLVEISGKCQFCVNYRIKSGSSEFPSFSGFIDTVIKASSTRDKRNMVEIKERRDVVIAFLRDFFDKYVLFVKNYSPDYNRKEQRLVLYGLPSASSQSSSRAYFGNAYPPEWSEFQNADPASVSICFDVNMKEDAKLIPMILEKGMKLKSGGDGFSTKDGNAAAKSKGKFFWTSSAMDFLPIYQRGGFSDADFYSVESLQQQYLRSILEPAQKTAGSGDHIPAMIVKDWSESGGNFGASRVFKQVVETCRNAWKYHFGYTDAENIWEGNQFTDVGRFYHYTGLKEYPDKMLKNKFNPDKFYSGMMPVVFGPDRAQKLIVEGNVFLRFFKIAFFDQFEVPFNLGDIQTTFGMPPIPLLFRSIADPPNFLNRSVPIEGEETFLMSRPVESVPVNSLFYDQLSPLPEGLDDDPINAFPCLRPMVFSNLYKTPEEFIEDRILNVGGEEVISIDGFLMIERGDLDLSKYKKFIGSGMIWINFPGNCFIGNLAKVREGDTLRIFVQDGDIIVKGPDANVKIEASLIATRYFEEEGRNPAKMENKGKFIPNKKGVEILGNLVVDHFFLKDPNYGVPPGKTLSIVHDPYLFGLEGQDFYRVSLGRIRNSFSINSDPSQSLMQ